MEEVLVFLKPDAIIRRYVGARAIKELIDAGFEVKYFGEISPSREFIASRHYAQHKGKFFYEWLVDYVTSSPLLVFILSGEDVIYEVRKLLGATIPEKADCNSIRGRYGIFGGINVAHASDSAESSMRELEIWREVIREEEGEEHDQDYLKKTEEYINRFIDSPMIDTMRYRELSRGVAEGEIGKEEARRIFEKLLSKESDFDVATLSKFAEIMIRNALNR
ncbi:MAG: nucleoside-diphosphate kinase [Candidatus Methanospirareceae archaeon]